MANLYSPSDLYQKPNASNNLGQSLRDAIMFKYQSEQQREQFGKLHDLEQQKVDNALDLGQGQLNLRSQELGENTRSHKADESETTRSAKVSEGYESLRITMETELNDATIAYKNSQTEENKQKLVAAQYQQSMLQRADINKNQVTEAKGFQDILEFEFGGDVNAMLADPKGKAVMDKAASAIFSDASVVALGGKDRDQVPDRVEIRRTKEGRYAPAAYHPDGTVTPLLGDNRDYSAVEVAAQISKFAGVDQGAVALASLEGQEAVEAYGNLPTTGETLVGATNTGDLKDRIARGFNADSVLGNTGGTSREAISRRSKLGSVVEDAKEQHRTDTTNRSTDRRNVAAEGDAKLDRVVPQLEARFAKSDTANATSGGIFDDDFEVFAGENDDDQAGRIAAMSNYIRQATADPRAVTHIARTLGIESTNTAEWTENDLLRAGELIVETQRKTTRGTYAFGGILNDLNQSEALPIPTLKQLQTTNNRINGG